MIHADSIPFDDAAEADLIDQHTPADDSDDEGLDPAQITQSAAANEADLIDQAFSVPLPDDDQ
jgi:hypothetical protein